MPKKYKPKKRASKYNMKPKTEYSFTRSPEETGRYLHYSDGTVVHSKAPARPKSVLENGSTLVKIIQMKLIDSY